MGFLKDFENEIKIFFVLVVLIIVAGWFGALSSFSFFQKEAREQERPVAQEHTQEEQEQPNGITEEENPPAGGEPEEQQEPETLTYRNENMGIAFEYPADWYVYDEDKWQSDNATAPCEVTATIENTIIISSTNLGRCVGVQQFRSWPGDLLVSFAEAPWQKFPFVMQDEDQVDLIEVGGVSTARYFFHENSPDDRKQAVRLYTNENNRGYIVEFTQTDTQGTYDPVFDEILASFQWL